MSEASAKMKIKQSYRDMSPKDKIIADYVLNNYKKVSRSTISDISKELDLADSTLFQFAKKLGYEGFKDFKIALLTENFDPEISIHSKITSKDSETIIAQKVFNASIQALKDTKKLISGNFYEKAANIMISSNKTVFFGLGGSNAVAYDCYHKFLRSPISCLYTSDYHMQLMNANLLEENDCAFIISHTGISKEAINIAKLAKKNKARIIVLTSYPLSTLAKMANVILTSTSEELSYRSESLASRLSQLCIIDALFVIIMFNNEEKSKKSLSKIRYAISETKE